MVILVKERERTTDRLSIDGPDFTLEDIMGDFDRRNYRVKLVAVQENRRSPRRQFLKKLGVEIPEGLSDLELSAIIHDTNLQPHIRAPFYYFELHPLRVTWLTIDYSNVFFHEHKGHHYATIEPSKSELTKHSREGIYEVTKPFLLPGTSTKPFLSSNISRSTFYNLVDPLSYSFDSTISDPSIQQLRDEYERYIEHAQRFYDAFFNLFSGDELQNYEKIKSSKIEPAHRHLPIFSYKNIKGEGHIDIKPKTIAEQVGVYLVGTDIDIKRSLSTFDQGLFILLETMGSLSSAPLFLELSTRFGYAGMAVGALDAMLCLDGAFRIGNVYSRGKVSGIIGEGFERISNGIHYFARGNISH